MNAPSSSHCLASLNFLPLPTDPTLIPLPTTSDADLHGPNVASASGCTPAVKVAGSCRKVIPDLKGKGKCRLEEMSELDVSDSEGESVPSKAKNAHGGRRPGAGNYQDADLKELLHLVEEELPIGGHGWKQISTRYAQWASHHSWPTCDSKALEMKFKMVCVDYFILFHC